MKRFLRGAAAGLAIAALAPASGALGHDSHADATSPTQAAACKLAQSLARQGVAADRVTASHCECLENKDDAAARWSCTAFVTYR